VRVVVRRPLHETDSDGVFNTPASRQPLSPRLGCFFITVRRKPQAFLAAPLICVHPGRTRTPAWGTSTPGD
jgi:hypothetical protein